MKLIDKIMETLSLYDEDDDGLDEELELKKPLAQAKAPEERAEGTSLFRKKSTTPTAAPVKTAAPVDLPAPIVPQAKEKKSFLSFKSSKPAAAKPEKAEKPAETGRMGSRTLNLPVANKMVNVVLLEPVSFDDSQKIADYLRGNEPVVVNFKETDNIVAKRMTDFISGTIYALGGSMKKLGRDILICAPKNVDIDAGEEMYDERGEQPWKK